MNKGLVGGLVAVIVVLLIVVVCVVILFSKHARKGRQYVNILYLMKSKSNILVIQCCNVHVPISGQTAKSRLVHFQLRQNW